MRVIGYDPFVMPERFQSIGVSLVTLDELLRESDFITLHLPLTPQNHHFLDDEPVRADEARRAGHQRRARRADLRRRAGTRPRQRQGRRRRHRRVRKGAASPGLAAGASPKRGRNAAPRRVGRRGAGAPLRGRGGAADHGPAAAEPAAYAVNAPFIAAEAFKFIAPLPAGRDARPAHWRPSSRPASSRASRSSTWASWSNHDTSPLKSAVIRGLLSPVSEENVTLVNASLIAEQRGMRSARARASTTASTRT